MHAVKRNKSSKKRIAKKWKVNELIITRVSMAHDRWPLICKHGPTWEASSNVKPSKKRHDRVKLAKHDTTHKTYDWESRLQHNHLTAKPQASWFTRTIPKQTWPNNTQHMIQSADCSTVTWQAKHETTWFTRPMPKQTWHHKWFKEPMPAGAPRQHASTFQPWLRLEWPQLSLCPCHLN